MVLTPLKRWLTSSATAIVLGLLGLLSQQAWAEMIGTVSYARGELSVIRGDSSLPVAVGDEIHRDDRLLTGDDGLFSASLIDGSVLTLGRSSEFLFSDYRWDGNEGSASLTFIKGAFRAITGALGKVATPVFEVRTPVATIGIRGTDFWGGFIFGDQLDVTVLDGKGVYVVAEGGRVELDKNWGTTVSRDDLTPTPPKIWPDEKLQKAIAAVSLE